jgi:lipoate-protein ligase A
VWLPLLVGLAVDATVHECGVESGLKWPNDVLVGGRKIAGILLERVDTPRDHVLQVRHDLRADRDRVVGEVRQPAVPAAAGDPAQPGTARTSRPRSSA